MSINPQLTQNPRFGDPSVPRGERNNNIGNIDYRTDRNRPGQLGSDGRFIRFASPEQGVQAAVEILHRYESAYGINTLRGMIGRWAPPNENNTANYIAHMERYVGVSADARLDLNDQTLIARIIQAKGYMENGAGPMQRTFTPQVIATGVQMAFANPSSIDGSRRTPTGTLPAGGVQVAGATPPGATPAGGTPAAGPTGAGTGRTTTGNVMTGGRTPQPSAQPTGGTGGQQQPEQGGDMFAQIVMALLAMLFGIGGNQMAQGQQPQPQDIGGLTPQATPPAPRQPTPAPAVG
ncbi:MAG: hypothetical protein C0436_03630 [Alphaproteobacteria bacterium]|nr:hypothetical protein [Alphaproteobacteria bacterium]